MKKNKSDEEEIKTADDEIGFLKQPHPAQIVGILRIMGVGYHPGEY
jgi:hypothetical protein